MRISLNLTSATANNSNQLTNISHRNFQNFHHYMKSGSNQNQNKSFISLQDRLMNFIVNIVEALKFKQIKKITTI